MLAQSYPSKPVTIICGQPAGSGPQIMIEVISGLLDTTFTSSVQALPQIAQGQSRPLATAAASRLKLLPDVPTLAE